MPMIYSYHATLERLIKHAVEEDKPLFVWIALKGAERLSTLRQLDGDWVEIMSVQKDFIVTCPARCDRADKLVRMTAWPKPSLTPIDSILTLRLQNIEALAPCGF